jgi:multisubunit Na+/H+ antiporter MnhG subunit
MYRKRQIKSILLVSLSIYIIHYIYILKFNDYYKKMKEYGRIESCGWRGTQSAGHGPISNQILLPRGHPN